MEDSKIMTLVVGFIVAFFLSFTTFLFLHNCANWPETENLVICQD